MVNFVECRAVWSYCYQAAGLEQQSSSPAAHLAFSQKVFFCFRFAGVAAGPYQAVAKTQIVESLH